MSTDLLRARAPRSWLFHVALGSYVVLIVLCIAWEWWLAPLRPGGSALVLKALPLLALLPALLRRSAYTMQLTAMLVLAYCAEGIVRGMTDPRPAAQLGWLELGLGLMHFTAALAYLAPLKRAARRQS